MTNGKKRHAVLKTCRQPEETEYHQYVLWNWPVSEAHDVFFIATLCTLLGVSNCHTATYRRPNFSLKHSLYSFLCALLVGIKYTPFQSY